MEKIGIICEYNPFHNGHIHHIKEIKKKYPDSIIILCLNGYFLQRGEISILDKYTKTKIALSYEVDIVIELPVLFGTQSADIFAYNSVYLLNQMKVDRIIFGSEKNDISLLKKIVELQDKEDYNSKIKKYLDKGINYPTAMAKALAINFDFTPNDLLGISYIKAIKKINNKINPETIQRTSNYLDLNEDTDIISASNIRSKLNNKENIDKYLPIDSLNNINHVNFELYYTMLKTIILQNDNLSKYLDVDEGIEYRLRKGIIKTNNLNDFIEFVKTKRYTYNKINRMLIHILLGIKKDDVKENLNYIKILGFNKIGKKYLNSIKKDLITIINKDSNIYNLELKAAFIYDILTNSNTYKKELENKPIIL